MGHWAQLFAADLEAHDEAFFTEDQAYVELAESACALAIKGFFNRHLAAFEATLLQREVIDLTPWPPPTPDAYLAAPLARDLVELFASLQRRKEKRWLAREAGWPVTRLDALVALCRQAREQGQRVWVLFVPELVTEPSGVEPSA